MDLLTLQCLVAQQPRRALKHGHEYGTFCAMCALKRTRRLFSATLDTEMLAGFAVVVPPIRVNLPPLRSICVWCAGALEFE